MLPPARWAAIPARLTGVQRAQPALATRRRCSAGSTAAAAPFRPTAPISEPPNQAASPTSCKERERVLSVAIALLLHARRDSSGEEQRPPAGRPCSMGHRLSAGLGGRA